MKRYFYFILMVGLLSACGQEYWATPFEEGQEVVLVANMSYPSSSFMPSSGGGQTD